MDSARSLSEGMLAGLLLAARPHLQALGLPCPPRDAIFHATGAGRSRAYVCRDAILGSIHELSCKPGRPPRAIADDDARLTRELVTFLLSHPGAACVRGRRHHYSAAFRRFVITLRGRYPALSTAALARSLHVPAATLRKWLDTTALAAAADAAQPERRLTTDSIPPRQLPRVLAAWRRWRGSLSGFCAHVQESLGVTLGRTALTRLLQRFGMRLSRRRCHPPLERALRQSFVTFFPGAQWIGDGATIPVDVNGTRCNLNLELMVDAASGAVVGTSIRDNEDSAAVAEAFDQAVATTGAPPLGLLLDNRPCNHSARVAAACSPATVLYAAKGRPQSKGHVEGAFGLFAQQAPPLVIHATSHAELARQVLGLVSLTWARALNHKPRRDRRGRSRVELYRMHAPTARDHEQALAALRHRQARRPRDARSGEPLRCAAARALLADAARDLAMGAIEPRLLTVMAHYPLAAVANAIALYHGKRDAGTLPEMASAEHRGRYLLALIRAMAEEHEEQAMARALLGWCDRAAAHLCTAWDRERAALAARHATRPAEEAAAARIDDCIERALEAGSRLEQCFWAGTIAELIRERGRHLRAALYGQACSRIRCSRALPRAHRRALVSMLAAALVPLD
jgi:hypothetical protein